MKPIKVIEGYDYWRVVDQETNQEIVYVDNTTDQGAGVADLLVACGYEVVYEEEF